MYYTRGGKTALSVRQYAQGPVPVKGRSSYSKHVVNFIQFETSWALNQLILCVL